ncbi:MAG: methyltransferase domain-containing protein [Dehalococcoidia bacterium]|nr:methyltransferase domain-containing protein [Dehalococcoidia bacterium]
MTEEIDFQIDKDLLRKGLAKYTRKAFGMTGKLDKPRILDVGCGSGVPTMELARLSNAEVVGLDINQPLLDRLAGKIEKAGLSDRVKTVKCSMLDMDFPDESFDIIWAEGFTFIIGFEKALKGWRRFLKPKGFLIAHEMTWSRPDPPQEVYNYWKGLAASGIRTVPEYLEQIPACGYDVVGHFTLPEDAWWTEYCVPLEKRIQELRLKYINDSKALEVLDKEQREIDVSREYHQWYGSAFLVMQRR